MSLRAEFSVETEYQKANAYWKNKEYKDAFSIFSKLAIEHNKLGAQFALGMMYQKGQGTDQDIKQAIHFYKLASDQGEVNAQFNLGKIYQQGEGTEQDSKKALHYYRLAAGQGYRFAQFKVGAMYQKGEGTEKDAKEALRYYTSAAKQGSRDAQYRLGIMYQTGQDTDQDPEKAMYYYTLAAKQGDKDAQYNLGMMYEEMKDPEKAIHYLTLAAKQGDKNAQYNLGVMYAEVKDLKNAIHYYTLAAKQGDQDSQFNIGLIYREGTMQDDSKAAYFFDLAAQQGHKESQFYLAEMYEEGRGVERDFDKASQLYHDSAKSGYAEAQSFLGREYFEPKSPLVKEPDSKQAQSFFSELTQQIHTVKGTFRLVDLIPEDCKNAWLPRYLPLPVYQKGYACGLYALSFGIKYAISEQEFNHYARKEGEKNKVKPDTIKERKDKAEKDLSTKDEMKKDEIKKDEIKKDETEKKVSLRSIAKELKYTSFGEIYDVRAFDVLTKHVKVSGGSVIHAGGDIKQEDYIKTICDHLKAGNNIIVACDRNGTTNFPGESKGLNAHWMHLFGYYYDKGQCYFLATQYGQYYAINGDELFESNKQLPEKIPLQGYYKIKSPGKKTIEKIVPVGQDASKDPGLRYPVTDSFEYFKFGIFGIGKRKDLGSRSDVVDLSLLPSSEKIKKWFEK